MKHYKICDGKTGKVLVEIDFFSSLYIPDPEYNHNVKSITRK